MRLIVIGGGAAGFFCAVTAARLNPLLEVEIIEKNNKVLSKVRISGGGRCNVTHACFSIPEMVKKYPRGGNFVKKTFHEFFTEDTISWFRERGVLLKTEQDGRMFPVSDSSQTIIECLLREANRYGVTIRMNRDVKSITKTINGWSLHFSDGTTESSDTICVACGGYPKDVMFDWLIEVGHSIESPVPSLFTFNMPGNEVTSLMGVSAKANIRIQGTKLVEEGPVLITHWGMSGPAVLKLSARGAKELHKLGYRFIAIVNWLPEYHEQSFQEMLYGFRNEISSQKIMGRNSFGLPQRLWEYICLTSDINESMRWADLPIAKQNKLIKNVCAHEYEVEGKTTYKEEFVTAGGIRLSEVNASTMESKVVKGLYFAGEIMDVDGITGGFNFQHAWTSGFIAGRSIAKAG